jgi:L-fuculose-phosphate aldolase
MAGFDLTQYAVVAMEDVAAALRAGATELVVREGAILTPSARDEIARRGIALQMEKPAAAPQPGGNAVSAYGGPGPAMPSSQASAKWDALFRSPEAEALKAEICAVGRKLWQRQYVDGNGGNISCRLTAETVICTPTLISKADLRPEDLCLVDLEGNQLAGGKPRTSEILMHLEIYKAVPEAKAVVHCHPVHATAYAITGRVPPTCVIPEFEVFIGRVALSPYETPGTQKFAETVIPFVKNHNTILLANHGIVCWADTVTHAEWYAEVLDTYCWTIMVANQLGAPISHIPPAKAADLVGIKQKLGLPDVRLDMKECSLCDLPEHPGAIALAPNSCCAAPGPAAPAEVNAIVEAVTDAVMAALGGKSEK